MDNINEKKQFIKKNIINMNNHDMIIHIIKKENNYTSNKNGLYIDLNSLSDDIIISIYNIIYNYIFNNSENKNEFINNSLDG